MADRLPDCRALAPALIRALATLLLVWQALVTPAHSHAGAAAPAGVASVKAHSSSPTRPDQPADCPICRQIAQAGAYLTPRGTAVLAPLRDAAPAATGVAAAHDAATVSHAWRSRAPPIVAFA